MDGFTALSDPTRREILEILAGAGRLSATEIYDRFPVSRPAISQHLKILREAGLVEVEKQAQYRYYRINPHPMRDLAAWIENMTHIYEERYRALDEVLQAEMDRQNSQEEIEL